MTGEQADAALTRLDVDHKGLDAMDIRYLRRLAEHHGGGPVGVETLAAALAEARDTLEDVVEPFLIQEGLLLRTSRGRMLGEPAGGISGSSRRKPGRISWICWGIWRKLFFETEIRYAARGVDAAWPFRAWP